MKPLAIDLFCGLGGWAEGFLAEGYDVIGFDVERHDYGTGGYPGQLVLQDVLTLDGAQFRDAAVIVASPPCQEFSYMGMPWARAKKKAEYIRSHQTEWARLTALFWACFRIAREAGVPLVVENVCKAQPWVGRAKWHYGSFYLWGDVPALMPSTAQLRIKSKISCEPRRFDERIASTPEEAHALHYRLPVETGQKISGYSDPRRNGGKGAHLTSQRENDGRNNGNDWFGSGENCSLQRRQSSRSDARKAASAHIAKIPFPLAQWIARCFKPESARMTA